MAESEDGGDESKGDTQGYEEGMEREENKPKEEKGFKPKKDKDNRAPKEESSEPERDPDQERLSEEADRLHRERRQRNEEERNQAVFDPFSVGNRPIGSFKGIDDDTVNRIAQSYHYTGKLEELYMGLQEEAEHNDVTGGDINKIAMIALAHLKEDPYYYSKLREAMKGTDDGQYYHEPNQLNLKPRGNITQPQNVPDPNRSHNKLEGNVKNKITCPQCGMPTLRNESNMDSISGREERFRCMNCQAYLTEQELIDNSVIENMTTTFMGNPSTAAVTHPNWSPKSKDLKKKVDDRLMSVKEFVGFDVSKSARHITRYANSEAYKKLLRRYFKDLSLQDRVRIKNAIQEGIKNNEGIGEISRRIERIVKDPQRAEVIARTETVRVTNEGNRQRMEERGIEKVVWISAPEDGRLCEECKSHDGEEYSIDEIKGKIPLHPNCRCLFTER